MSLEHHSPNQTEQKDFKSILDNAKAIPLVMSLKRLYEQGLSTHDAEVNRISSELIGLFEPMIQRTAQVFLNSYEYFLGNIGIKQDDLEQMLREMFLLPATFKNLNEEQSGNYIVPLFITIFHRRLIHEIIVPQSRKKRFDKTYSLSKFNSKGWYTGQNEPAIEDQNATQAREYFEDDDAIKEINKVLLTIRDPIDSFIFIARNGLGTEIFQAWLDTHKNTLLLWSKKLDKSKKDPFIDKKIFANRILEDKLPNHFMEDGKDFSEIGGQLGMSREWVRLRETKIFQRLTVGLNRKDFLGMKKTREL